MSANNNRGPMLPVTIVITIIFAISAALGTYFTAQAGITADVERNTAKIEALEKNMERILDKLDSIEGLLRPPAKK